MSAGAGGSARRRRAVVLLSLALAAGGLAASQVRGTVAEVETRTGRPVPVVVAREEIPRGRRIAAGAAERLLAVRQVPERFAPPDSLASVEDAVGLRAAIPLARGAYLSAGALSAPGPSGGRRRGALRAGERAVELEVAGAGEQLAAAAAATAAGAGGGTGEPPRVDVLATTEPREGAGRTYVALADVELLAARPAEGGEGPAGAGDGGGAGAGGSPSATAAVTLRVTAAQAVYLTAAQSFSRELRLLVRPPGDRRGLRTSVGAGDL